MAEVPEHLLKRSRERRKALGLPVDGEEDDAPAAEAPDAGGGETAPAEEAAPVAASADAGESHHRKRGGVPAALLERSPAQGRTRRRRWRRGTFGWRRHRDRDTAARSGRDGTRAERHGTGRSHPAAPHRRQVRFDPANARRRAGQGARLAATSSSSSSRRSCRSPRSSPSSPRS